MKYLSLAIVAGFFAFTACGPGQQQDDQTDAEDTATVEQDLAEMEADTAEEEAEPAADINTLKEMAGQTITVDSLTNIEEVNNRLKRTLGEDYDRFKEVSTIAGEATMEGDLFYVIFNRESGATGPGSAFIVDYATDEVFAGLNDGEEIPVYAEKGGDLPELMEKWATGQL